MPRVGCEVNFSNLIPDETCRNIKDYINFSVHLLANFNSFIFDYITRQKLQGQTLNWYIIEQLPVIKPKTFNQQMESETPVSMIFGKMFSDKTPWIRNL